MDHPPMDTTAPRHLPAAELIAGLAEVDRSPRGSGRLDLVVRRPAVDERELLAEGTLDITDGLVGDSWAQRGSSKTGDGSAHPDRQLTVMNSRFVRLVAGDDPQHWGLAGDQLFADLDLHTDALPAGTRLAVGDEAVIEVTAELHNGCAKFANRYGRDAHKLVWSEQGRQARLRGLYARVVVGGVIRPGDQIRVLGTAADATEGTAMTLNPPVQGA
ncbi:MOSC domain-containing protein [Solwaraspora sp. WMMD937]|uniref:MOSC domain-containing protein n=1 Tax=Solwaraspora sp. WMMD937 TaxID=3016090 RepID=UPI00249C3407|nr:MOSC domain-containing protein [Solwaraspora sp. WMMD937]WFE19651.1 MOSC domain-containing protein [Solwaraspora sp. WMMD937]